MSFGNQKVSNVWHPCLRILFPFVSSHCFYKNIFYLFFRKKKKKGTPSVGDEEEGEEEAEDDLDLYSYKWENLTRAEQNQW